MMGPEGCGILYVRREWQDRIKPVEFGWTNVAQYADYKSREMTLREDAGRYECGTLNTIGCFGLRAAIEFMLDVGIERVGSTVQALADQLAAGLHARGYQLMRERTPANGAGIVTCRRDGVDARQVVSTLRHHKMIAAPRQGWVRFSPHFYISPTDIQQVIEALP
jgi:selenocysteine lyase/cysteine desulfurase